MTRQNGANPRMPTHIPGHRVTSAGLPSGAPAPTRVPPPVPGPRSPSCRHRLWRIPWGRRSRRAGTRHRAWRHHRTRRLPERGGRSAGQATVGHPISPTRPIGLPGFACPDGPLGRCRSCRRRHRCCRAAQPGCRDAGQCRRPEHRGRRRSGCARRPGALCCRPAIGAGDRGAIASPQTRVRAKSEQRGRAGAAGRHDTERAGLGAVARPCGRAPRRRRPGRRRPERRFAHPRGDRPADRPPAPAKPVRTRCRVVGQARAAGRSDGHHVDRSRAGCRCDTTTGRRADTRAPGPRAQPGRPAAPAGPAGPAVPNSSPPPRLPPRRRRRTPSAPLSPRAAPPRRSSAGSKHSGAPTRAPVTPISANS